jgi:molecular chaperone DnaK
MSETIIGIDLGTTNSEVAIIADGQPIVCKEANDASGIMPSVVGLDSSGKLLVGRSARNQQVAAPERTIASVKRQMGQDCRLSLGDKTYSPQELSAMILRALKERAEQQLGHAVGKAVVTVPAYFTDAQRQATREAGAIAGLDIVRILNEPTAAALAYGAGAADAGKILVYDLGGGTFDVSVVSAENGVVEVMATAGDNHLGGDDFDQLIAGVLADQLQQKHEVDVKADKRVMARLLRAAETAKIQLSSSPFALIEEDHLLEADGTPVHLHYELSRAHFEDLIEPLVTRTIEAMDRALADANVVPSDLAKIILVGGSSRIPRVRQRLNERLAQQPHEEVDPDLCVALGAALQAGIDMGLDVNAVLVDISPYTFGTGCHGFLYGAPYAHQYLAIIPRNSKLPVERSEVFFKMHEEQNQVSIEIFQGENPDAMQNVRVGNFMFSGLKEGDRAQESGLVLTYRLDVDGILQVTAVERSTGKKMTCTVDNAMAAHDPARVTAAQARLADLWRETSEFTADAADSDSNPAELPADLRALLDRTHEFIETASEEDKVELIDLTEKVHESHQQGAAEALQTHRKKLEDILFYLGH